MVASALFAQEKLEIHSAPEGERLSEDFRVWVNGRELPVYYKADRNEPAYQEDSRRFGKGGGDYSFAYFDFKGWSQLRGRDMNIETILVEGSTFWCDRARVFLLGHESKARHMRAITVRDCDIIHFAMVPFLIEPADDMRISQIIFSDIRVHGEGQHELIRLRPVELPEYKIPGFGSIDGVRFEDITLEGKHGAYQVQLYGVNRNQTVRNVTLRKVVIQGNNLGQDQSYIKRNEHVRNLRIEE